ncbi:MAG TPA: hypothetical protein VNX01_02630 [Bacteroidia bacterium]|jgi:hypothetical protein|nr:hypothetical protein [Bacteroidia bacterium]
MNREWKNANDSVPLDKQKVILNIDGQTYNAAYDAEKNAFKLKNSLNIFWIEIKSRTIYWVEEI